MKVTVYSAEDGYRWRAAASNGEIVIDSGAAYKKKSYAMEAARRFVCAGGDGEDEDELEFEYEFEGEWEDEEFQGS
jgi:uncharacterized protein YegP (UPF0339 family)